MTYYSSTFLYSNLLMYHRFVSHSLLRWDKIRQWRVPPHSVCLPKWSPDAGSSVQGADLGRHTDFEGRNLGLGQWANH